MPEDRHSATVPPDLIELGRIVAAYGIRGWVKVQPHSAQADVLLDTASWWLKAPVPVHGGAGALPYARHARVQASRPQGAAIVAQLDLSPDRNAAESFKGHTVWVPRSEFPAPEDDEYYWIDLIGCSLYGVAEDGASALIGVVQDVADNGAHALLRVERAGLDAQGAPVPVLDAKGRPLEVLVPFVAAHIGAVDLAAKRIDSDWPLDF
ncbi:ribosome maturation factor RimM [Candidimonas humi]|jgi:16S rRNA processing protein RimM|uniref:Ribosome maturation factor RimM n=1 Tax=Candidimonas humi TaxID=683355 RepID=A0ABV8NV37_9BURK|nr:ribosome maturation factor RimM [Candidimonas humi]MBV6303801.1 ribosome maturation factor RimM [Candidimonas humi]